MVWFPEALDVAVELSSISPQAFASMTAERASATRRAEEEQNAEDATGMRYLDPTPSPTRPNAVPYPMRYLVHTPSPT